MRKRKTERKDPEVLPDGGCPTDECAGPCDPEAHGIFGPEVAAEPEPTTEELVRLELLRMADRDTGGSCSLFREPPKVRPEVAAEVRRVLLEEPGAKLTPVVAGIPGVLCFERDARAVILDALARYGRRA